MPYAIEKRGDEWCVVNTEKNETKACHKSKIKAQRQINLLRAVDHGWEPTGAKARK